MRELIRHILHEELRKWTKEEVIDLAKNFTRMNHFKITHPRAYAAARRNKWLDDIRPFMVPAYVEWDKEKVHQEALKYETRRQFQTHSKKAYQVARYNGWLDDVTTHMENRQNLWNPDDIWNEALKYNHIRDFIKGSPNAYAAAKRRPNYQEIVSHMTPLGNRLNRFIYSYEFPDNTVYVGLTFDLNARDKQHRKKEKSAVYQHIKSTGLEPEFKQITDSFVSAIDAKVLEQKIIEKYINEGWKILNIATAGGLGSSVLDNWTKEMVIEVAKKYETKNEFCIKERRACLIAKRNGWYEDATKHMRITKIMWDEDLIKKEAEKYTNKTDFKKGSPNAYRAAEVRGILDNITQNMSPSRINKYDKIWDRESAEKEVSKFNNIKDLRDNEGGLYMAIHRHGWNDLLNRLESKIIKWDENSIMDKAKLYDRVIDFRNGDSKAYNAAKRLGIINKVRDLYGQKHRKTPNSTNV